MATFFPPRLNLFAYVERLAQIELGIQRGGILPETKWVSGSDEPKLRRVEVTRRSGKKVEARVIYISRGWAKKQIMPLLDEFLKPEKWQDDL